MYIPLAQEIRFKTDDQNQEVPLEPMEVALADATAQLELSEGISSNVVERFRRFEKEVSHSLGLVLIGSTTNWLKRSSSKKRIFRKLPRA